MVPPRSFSCLVEKEGDSKRSRGQSSSTSMKNSNSPMEAGRGALGEVSSPDRRQMEGYITLPDSFILTVTFWGLPQTPHALLSSAWLSELLQYLVWNISCSPTGNKYENSKGVVSMATTTSWKVLELLPPTHGTAEIQKAEGIKTSANYLTWICCGGQKKDKCTAVWQTFLIGTYPNYFLEVNHGHIIVIFFFLLEVAPGIKERVICLTQWEAQPHAFEGASCFLGLSFGQRGRSEHIDADISHLGGRCRGTTAHNNQYSNADHCGLKHLVFEVWAQVLIRQMGFVSSPEGFPLVKKPRCEGGLAPRWEHFDQWEARTSPSPAADTILGMAFPYSPSGNISLVWAGAPAKLRLVSKAFPRERTHHLMFASHPSSIPLSSLLLPQSVTFP